jgi:hypothetical protein
VRKSRTTAIGRPDAGAGDMTHGYEFFDYDYVDLGDYYADIEDWADWETGISEDWHEIAEIYDEYEFDDTFEGIF